MGRIHVLLYLYMSSSLFAQQPQIQFQSVPDPLKLPAHLYLGEAAGVAVNSKGHIFVLSRGNSYISDGYINSRIAKVDKNGKWIKSWGEPGDQAGQFSTPHSIAIDAEDHVYVADRGNRRIQVFDSEGKFLRQITIDVAFDPNASPAIGNKPVLPIKGSQTMA